MTERIKKSEEEWMRELGPQRYHVLREHGTEPAFTGELQNNKSEGVYRCAGCGAELFSSDTKYDSGSGWPSFYLPISDDRVEEKTDRSHFMTRTEILCAKCGGHLGHVFDDGPKPTGLRYCVNSASLKFEESKKKER
jgi:peptide-methionine (R)-S-oxide reductase